MYITFFFFLIVSFTCHYFPSNTYTSSCIYYTSTQCYS
uniref:Uncharacterized protein n=1 Tax=Anguilla anguilla TaxID=7936 RepID=A0A0E9XC64_ANGAN